MTLKEKFKDIINDAITYDQQYDSFEQIAKEFTIGFADWFAVYQTEEVFYEENYTKEMLEKYIKEKKL